MRIPAAINKTAPVVLLAAPKRQAEILAMVAEGEVEFVVRRGEFIRWPRGW